MTDPKPFAATYSPQSLLRGQGAQVERMTVLVVDDDPMVLEAMCRALVDSCRTLVARSGVEALAVTRREQPDLIILDVMMPEMDGYEVLRQLRGEQTTWHIPVIFLTSKNEETDEKIGLDLGAVDYWSKPFSIEIVRSRVRTHLELKRQRDQLTLMALTDGLTGLLNRRAFGDVMERELRRCRRGQPLTLLLIDVDHFKRYNDYYGHQVGDDCLKSMAEVIRSHMARPGDSAARYGGEEFACILPKTDAEGGAVIAERIRGAVEALGIEHATSTTSDRVTVSIGLATSGDSDAMEAASLITLVDEALYRAKARGRNRVCRDKQ